MKNNKNLITTLFILTMFMLTGCENKLATGDVDEPTMAKKKIAVDETFKPVFEELEKQFESLYPNAHLTIVYAPESQVVDLLLKDSVQIIFIARDLTAAEKAVIEKRGIVQKTTGVAYDGVAMVVNKNNKMKVMTQDALNRIFSGKALSFDELQDDLPKQNFSLVFENSLAGTVSYFAGKFGPGFTSAKNVFDAKSPKELIDYVSNNADAIGFLSSIYVYDDADTSHTTFIKDVKVLEMEVPDSLNSTEKAVGPWQYYVAFRYDPAENVQKQPPLYSLVRTLNSINYEGRAGLGQGFTAYVAGELGQRTVLRFGLVPARMPLRIVQITNENIQIK